jgi:hypothetical protein
VALVLTIARYEPDFVVEHMLLPITQVPVYDAHMHIAMRCFHSLLLGSEPEDIEWSVACVRAPYHSDCVVI